MTPAEIQQAAEAMQAQLEEALGIDADTEIAASTGGDNHSEWPEVVLSEKAVKRVLELAAEEARVRAVMADLLEECARCRAGRRLVMPSYIEKRVAK